MEEGGMGCFLESRKIMKKMRQRSMFGHLVTHGDVR
jgi:hypothetical protein